MSKLNEEELIKLIEEALELKSESVNIQSSSEDFEEWDSLGHLNILVSLDNKCDGNAAEIAELATASSNLPCSSNTMPILFKASA